MTLTSMKGGSLPNQFLNHRIGKIRLGDNAHARVNMLRYRLPSYRRDGGFHAFISHFHWILSDQCIDIAGLECIDQLRRGVESNKLDFSGQSRLSQRQQPSEGAAFIRADDSVGASLAVAPANRFSLRTLMSGFFLMTLRNPLSRSVVLAEPS